MARSLRGLRLRFGASATNHAALRLLGSRLPRLTGGWMPWLSLDRYDPPPLRGPDWVRLRPILSGVCGTDTGLLTGHASAVLSPFASFPAVLGHEVVGVVEATGQRVVLDPVISCTVRGLEPCRRCAAGQARFCLRAADGDLSPGMLIGYCADLPGGWSDGMVAHASQLHPVPEQLSDEVAVLLEPFSVALHAVLARPPEAGERVLVIGGGTLGLCTVAALRLVAPRAEVVLLARHGTQRDMGERLGAGSAAGGRDAAVQAAIRHAGARAHRSILGQVVLSGGFTQVYDAVGSQRSLADAMRVAEPGGRMVLVGGPGQVSGLDWTLAWTRELRIEGTYVYGSEPSLPGSPHTFDEAIRLLVANPQMPLGELVTHRFRLEEWRRAMAVSLTRGKSGALKVVFTP
ncbi:MAG TPA: alcohol dehydrogenase catalytic domain-containing protein [Candidatus Limnocylindrales bacterium]|nr:alcohol dehydrogenase catalytic domain-containing protein [Candidatus Limnocylindrales bacterium]